MKKIVRIFALSAFFLSGLAISASAQVVLRGTQRLPVVGDLTCEGLGTDLLIAQPTGVWMILKISSAGKIMPGTGVRMHVRGNMCRFGAIASRSSLTKDEDGIGALTLALTPEGSSGQDRFRCPARTVHFDLVGTNNEARTLKFLGADDGFEAGGSCFQVEN